MDLWFHSIHYLDTLRSWLGEPDRAYCVTSRVANQAARGETRSTSILSFSGGRTALVSVNHENRAGDNAATFRVEGTQGALRGTVGLLYDYPDGRPDTPEVLSHALPIDGWPPYPITTRWIPDAFIGPMASLLHAAHTRGSEPETSGHDNLETIRPVEALYRSAECGEAVADQETLE